MEQPIASHTPNVGVVIPVYNRPSLLLETLEYVLAQTLQPSHVVIADDGSTDGTPEKVESWLNERKPRFKWSVLRLEKATAASARANGFKQLDDVPYVAFCDSDDHWPCDFLERTTRALQCSPEAVLATVDRKYHIENGEPQQSKAGAEIVQAPIDWLFDNGGGIASCSLLRSSAYLKTGGWDASFQYSEDTLLFCNMALEGAFVYVDGAPVVFHLGNAHKHNEEGNLSRRYVDAELRGATQLEKIYIRVCQKSPRIDTKPLKQTLSQRWLYAGRRQRSLKVYTTAKQCFKRSIRWNPFQVEAWRRYLAACRKSLRQRA